jgi:hypothetical protein
MRLRALVLLGAAATLACADRYQPAPSALEPESLRGAWATLQEIARAESFEIVEDGLYAETYLYEERVHVEWDEPLPPDDDLRVLVPPAPRVVRQRVPIGPERRYLPFRHLASVHAERWPIGASVEFRLDEGDVEGMIQVSDFERAKRMADALELLRRARRGESVSEPPSDSAPLEPEADGPPAP